jgi:DNA processing protein
VIGARACTAYGEHVTAELVAGLGTSGWTVVSGGAYGIDAVAHRAALAAGGQTIAFLAGGVDRLYPSGNTRLLEAVADGGAVVSEVPPGSVPTKTRFLLRNRLIAASALATVVVEAAWRSGALSTARHAAALLRPVGAVPGPVTSAASAGCHRLLREGSAVCVTDAAEVADLAGGLGSDLAADPVPDARPEDGLGAELRRTLDGLPVRRPVAPESVARSAGLTLVETRSALGRLELAGLAEQDGGLWRRAPGPRKG